MAIKYVSPTGTKTSGDSTPADYSNTNCYATPKTALAAVTSGWTSSDEIIILDGTYPFNNLETNTASADTGTVIKFRSNSGDPTACILRSSSASLPFINANKGSSVVYSLSFTGITFTKTVTHTTSSVGVFTHFPQPHAGGIDFVDCKFIDTNFDYSGSSVYGYFNLGSNGARDTTFSNCVFDNLTSTSLGGLSLMTALWAGCTVDFTDCTFSNLTHIPKAGAGYAGGITGTLVVSVTNCVIDTVLVENPATIASANYPLFMVSAGITVNGLTASNITLTGGSTGPVVIHTTGPFDINNLKVTNCTSTPATDVNTTGGTFLANSEAAQGTGSNFTIDNCISNHGVGLYVTQGGGGTFTNINVNNSTSRVQGILDASGWGDCTIDGFSVTNCQTGTIIDPVDAGLGGGIYAHNHATQATRVAVRSFKNGSIIGVTNNRDGGYNGIFIRNGNTTYSHDVEISNVVVDCPGQKYIIGFTESAGSSLNIFGGGNYVNGGDSSVEVDYLGSGSHSVNFSEIGNVRQGITRKNSVVRTFA